MTSEMNNISALDTTLDLHGPVYNDSYYPEYPGTEHYHWYRTIATFTTPLTCAVGLICNILAVRTFLHKTLRKYSCSMYLVTKLISDTLFLMNLAVIYISGCFAFGITITHTICKIVIFVTYMSGFISVWSVILVTMENFIRICFPFDVKRLCTPRNAYVGIGAVVVTSLCVYHTSLWITDEYCQPILHFTRITNGFIFVDTLLTLILPSIILFLLVLAIIFKMISLQGGGHRKQQSAVTQTMLPGGTTQVRHNGQTGKAGAQMAAVTKMLLAVSLTFFVLTVPSHIVRIKFLVSSFVTGDRTVSNTAAAVQGIAQILYYASMAVNLFIFLIFGDNFRRVFKKIYTKGKTTECSVSDSDKEAVNGCERYTNSVNDCADEQTCLSNTSTPRACVRTTHL